LIKISAGFIVACLLIGSVTTVWPSPKTDETSLTKAENQEAREVALQFTLRWSETRSLSPIVNDLYFADFIERYRKFRAKDTGPKAVDLYFAPGLDYNSRLLTLGESRDWARLYVAVNDFLLFGFVRVLKNSSDQSKDIKDTDMYPSAVVKLLNSNPILANMIVHKEGAKPVVTVEEMHAVSATLEKAVMMMREQQKGGPPVIRHKDELIKMAQTDSFFEPRVEVMDEEFFGFPKGTQILFVKTAIGLELMLTRENDRLKVFWSEIVHD
jgi:hypothetical protein